MTDFSSGRSVRSAVLLMTLTRDTTFLGWDTLSYHLLDGRHLVMLIFDSGLKVGIACPGCAAETEHLRASGLTRSRSSRPAVSSGLHLCWGILSCRSCRGSTLSTHEAARRRDVMHACGKQRSFSRADCLGMFEPAPASRDTLPSPEGPTLPSLQSKGASAAQGKRAGDNMGELRLHGKLRG